MCCPTLAGSGTNAWQMTRMCGRLEASVARAPRLDLVVNPAIRLLHPVAKPGVGLPAEDLLDEGVVGVATIDALGSRQVVLALELDLGDLLDDVDQLVDADQLARAEVDRLDPVAVGDLVDALDAVRDVH